MKTAVDQTVMIMKGMMINGLELSLDGLHPDTAE
jgi:hypothetical protein